MTPSGGCGFTVTAKIATSLDGRIALANGQSQWITSEAARNIGHRLRAAHDILLVGSGTVIADNPQLTARPDGTTSRRQPVRVVLDRRGRLTGGEAIFASAKPEAPVIILSNSWPGFELRSGISVLTSRATAASLRALLSEVSGETRTRRASPCAKIYCEGGGQLLASLLKDDLISRIEWFRAPKILGGDGIAAFAPLGLDRLEDVTTWKRNSVHALGPDLWERYERSE